LGVVLQAFHLHFVARVAIKFHHKGLGANVEALARFEREARAAFKIKSEHVARVIDVGKLDDGMPFIVMEFLEGIDLADLLARDTRLPLDGAINFIMQTAEAVAEAHTLGIVHRDLKPENLFLTQRSDGSPCIKVLDFGLSKVQPTEGTRTRERTLTATTQPMGTPQYMSPEQWMSAKDVGPATDIWSLGVILYELVTGRQPFYQKQLAQLCTMVLQVEPEPMDKHVADVPVALQQLVMRCLMKKPEERYPHIAALALELYQLSPNPQLRASAKRIAGVCRRAGIAVSDELPESGSAPSALMVLGYAPPSGDGSKPDVRPSRGKAYESDTQVMPEEATVDDDLSKTVPHPGAQSPLRGESDTFEAPYAQAVENRDAPGVSGQHPAVPVGDAGSSGRFMAYSGDASVSGNYAAQRPQEAPAAMMGAQAAAPKPRADTAQSWHRIVNASQRAQTGSRRVAIAVGASGLLVIILAIVAIWGGGGGGESATPDTARAPAITEPAGETEVEGANEGQSDEPAAAASTAGPAVSASASASVEPATPPPRQFGPAVGPKPRPPVVKSQPKRPIDIFSGR
jgi:serine/threonine protein kinase